MITLDELNELAKKLPDPQYVPDRYWRAPIIPQPKLSFNSDDLQDPSQFNIRTVDFEKSLFSDGNKVFTRWVCKEPVIIGKVMEDTKFDEDIISDFRDQYSFLSNFYQLGLDFKDKTGCFTVEHAFQASKTNDMTMKEMIKHAPSPSTAKRMGRNVPLREDWDVVKDSMMEFFLRVKFENPELKKLLLETKGKTLVEGNVWHDNYWGNCKCEKCQSVPGKNMLGKLLMKIRDEL
jgi:hypothetical protein